MKPSATSKSIAALLLAVTASFAAPAPQRPVPNRPPLQANAFNLLPLGTVHPKGWLLEQLNIQANGLSGHLDEFWPDLSSNSAWLGGTGEGWERGPYYLDGLVPLAYLTGNDQLIAKVKKWLEWTLTHQTAEGWIGPEKNQDWWPNFVMLKVLTQYQEATGDARVVPLMEKYFAYQMAHIDQRPLKEWAIYRWQDEVLSILWLYNRNGDAKLLDLARKLHDQGKDWETPFAQDTLYTGKVTKTEIGLDTHGVNGAMALKAAAVWSLVTGQNSDRQALYTMFRELDKYHLLPNGVHSSDEHYAGNDPSQGTELCSVVEAMFSLETDMSILGDPAFGDRLEKIAYNALPGTMTADLWAHQYDQQPNQVLCSLSKRDWTSNGPESNIFGLEPNFGCCTANLHQGWPKLAANLWMATPKGGLAAVAYGPSEVRTSIQGTAVSVEETTDYPFREKISLAVRAERPVAFDLQLRIPEWADAAVVEVNGQKVLAKSGEFLTIERTWKNGDRVEIYFPMQVRASRWAHGSVAIERGPLVYSLKIGESWRVEKQFGPSKDYEVFPTTPWNYALVMDPGHPADAFQVKEEPMAKQPYQADHAPVILTAKARRIPDWQLDDSSAGKVPQSPVKTKQRDETVTLVPYGAAKLRITAFPYTSAAEPQDSSAGN